MTAAVEEARALFPPELGPVLVIGNAANLFPRHLAALWRSMGLDAWIVTRRWNGERILPDGTPVLVASDHETPGRQRLYLWAERGVQAVESRVIRCQQSRYASAMGSETSYRPRVAESVPDAFSIARFVRALHPQFVCGQEVFSYGLATALSRGVPRLLMPWGGDVFMYANTTSMASASVRFALRQVDLVVPGSPIAGDYLHRRFGVPFDRMHFGGLWRLDRQRFRRAPDGSRLEIRRRYGIDRNALVVMNVRRFFPAWGSDLAFKAFVRFAGENPASHFVLLGGAGTETFVADARAVLARQSLTSRFTLFNGDISLDECSALMSVSDIFVSLMRERDMRPLASILEAASCGGAPVIGDQPEYRAMERVGFRAIFCTSGDEDGVVGALQQYARSAALRIEVARANHDYLDVHEDGDQQAIALLRRVRSICDAYAATKRRESVTNTA